MADSIIYLDRNENNYGPAPACFEVLQQATFEALSLYSKDFTRGVKSTLSERLANDFDVPENSILLGYGGEDILKQVIHCYLEEGETLMIPSHSWWYYKSIADEKKGKTVEYPMKAGKDSFLYDLDHLLRLSDQHHPKIILISSPNNPTGNTLSLEDLRIILDKVKKTIVVLDEAYWGFGNSQSNNYVKELISVYPDLLIIRTFSKYYALAGLRIGYGFFGENLTVLSQFSARYLGYNRLSERLALAALDSSDYYSSITQKMAQDKERYYQELGKIPGFKVYRSDANFILIEIPEAIKVFLKEYLSRQGIIVKFFNEKYLENSMRITIGTGEQNECLIQTIKKFVKEKGL